MQVDETAEAILDALLPHTALIDPHGMIVMVNESWRRFANENDLKIPDYGVGQNYLSLCDHLEGSDSAEGQRMANGIRGVLHGDLAEFTIDYPCHSPGEKRWFRLQVSPVIRSKFSGAVVTHTNITGENLGKQEARVSEERGLVSEDSLRASVIGTDITEQKRSEEKYRQSEERLQSILNSSRDGILVESDGLIVYINQSYLRLLGYNRPEDVIGKDVSCLVTADVYERLTEFGRRRLRGEEAPTLYEFALKKKDGTSVLVEGAVSVSTVSGKKYVTTAVRDITERKLAESALRESADEFRMLSEAMPQIVWMSRPDGLNIYTNQRWVDFTGLTVEESYGHGWNTPFHPEDLQRAWEMWKHATETGEAYEVECRLRKADASYHWMLIRGLPLRDSSGIVTKWLGTCTDIHEMKQAMEAVRASENRFKLFANVTNDAIWDWNLSTDEWWGSEGYNTLFGYSEEELGRTRDWWSGRIAPEDRERVLNSLDAVVKGDGTRWSEEYHFLRSDGSRAYVLDRGHLLRDAAGQPVRMTGDMTDLSERQAAVERLAQQAALIDDARDAMIVRDLDHRITFWSKGAERLYGWRCEDVLGLRSNELFKIDSQQFDAAVKTVLATDAWSGEVAKTTASGVILTVDCRWTLLRDPQGRPKSVFNIDTDITERKKLEQHFLRSQRMESVGTLAGGIAHDLNNLLMPIMMGTSLLRRFEPAEKSLKVIQNIEQSTKRAAELVKQVLSFARGVEGARVAVHFADVVREVAAIAHNTFPKSIAFESSVAKDLWSIAGDPTQISHVLVNLCVNARDAMPDGGRLQVSAENLEVNQQNATFHPVVRSGQYVVLTVTDNGSGMTKKVADRIFEPFFTTKEFGQGTGLGLSTAIGIIRGHGGVINVATEPGKGTTFTIYFPPRTEQSRAPDANRTTAATPRRGHGELILVVDDEPGVLSITKETLETFGYEVLTAVSGAQALERYTSEHHRIAMVLTDMMMPGMTGPELIPKLRLIDPSVIIVAVTGLDNTLNVSRAEKAGVNRFLTKPYTAELLMETLFGVLQKRSPEAVRAQAIAHVN